MGAGEERSQEFCHMTSFTWWWMFVEFPFSLDLGYLSQWITPSLKYISLSDSQKQHRFVCLLVLSTCQAANYCFLFLTVIFVSKSSTFWRFTWFCPRIFFFFYLTYTLCLNNVVYILFIQFTCWQIQNVYPSDFHYESD